MKILTPHHKQLDFSWVKLPASARKTLTLVAYALLLSSASALCALVIFTKAVAASDHSTASTALAAPKPL